LQPEKGKTVNLGVVFEASRNVSASVDVWRINKTNDISTPTIATAIRNGLFRKTGARFDIFTNLQNSAERETAGVDVDARIRLPGTAIGNVAIRNLLTYYHTNKTRAVGDEWAEFNGTYATPRFRNGFSVTTEKGPWNVGASIRTTGGFWDTDESFPIANGTRRVGSHEELDLSVQYAGIKNFEISGGIKNALDNMPPFSLQNASDNQYSQMGFAELYTSRGRFFYISAKYTFR
jgi:iron complex outermembrane recepter protein